MPYKVTKDESKCPSSKPWAVINKDTGEKMGCHKTKEKAERQRRAIEANTDESKHSRPTVKQLADRMFGRTIDKD